MADKTIAKRQAQRRAALNRAALFFGFSTWTRYETAIINQYGTMEGNDGNKTSSMESRQEAKQV